MILATGILLLRKESSMILARFLLFLHSLDRLFPMNANDILNSTEPPQDVVKNAFDGYNVCVFAYGQTGSGKTYTVYNLFYFVPHSLYA